MILRFERDVLVGYDVGREALPSFVQPDARVTRKLRDSPVT